MPQNIDIRAAKPAEINWINDQYRLIGFLPSDFTNEFIVIAECYGEKIGIGRIVLLDDEHTELGGIYVTSEFRGKGIAHRIVKFLLDKNPYDFRHIWCIPFKKLNRFYEKFYFTEIDLDSGHLPEKILKKLNWCAENISEPVSLMHRMYNKSNEKRLIKF